MLAVADRARDDLVAGRAAGFCALLTPHGRSRALGYRVDFDEGGSLPPTSPRVPHTCEQIVRRERAAVIDPRVEFSWLDALRGARLRVLAVEGDSARVGVVPRGGPRVAARVALVRTEAGWRLDDSDAIPSGH